MTINNSEELRLFEQCIDRCRRSVYAVTDRGQQYDLKTPFGRHRGLELLLDGSQDVEIYTNCHEDDMVMFEYIDFIRACA